MIASDVLRHDLAAALLDCAERRRRSRAGGEATGEDLKIVALFEHLAADVVNLDPHLVLSSRLALPHTHLARGLVQHRDLLFAQVGVTFAPKDATDLVSWMDRHSLARDRLGSGTRSVRDRCDERKAPASLGVTAAGDFCAGFGIVAPMLAVWEVGQAIGQWRDHVLSGSRPAVQASVVATRSVVGGRGASMAADVVLDFRPAPSAATCRVSVRLGPVALQPEPGTTLTVVPRSSDCEPPLVSAQIGNPMVTFALAAGLLAGGLTALMFWGRLGRRHRAKPARPAQGPAWSRSGTVVGRP